MPVFSDGQKISAALAWDRMIQSVPASYVVWKDGSTYRAECLLKGGTDYSGTDAATVIQSAIDALANGGTIFIKQGVYSCSSSLNVTTPCISLIGEGLSTELDFLTSDGIVITYYGTGVNIFGRHLIKDLFIRGGTTGSGIKMSSMRSIIDHVRVEGFDIGIHLGHDSSHDYHEMFVHNSFVRWNRDNETYPTHGIVFDQYAPDSGIYYSIIETRGTSHIRIRQSSIYVVGVHTYGSSDNSVLIDPTGAVTNVWLLSSFFETATQHMINVTPGSYVGSLTIKNNRLTAGTLEAHNTYDAIHIEPAEGQNTIYLTVKDNIIYGCSNELKYRYAVYVENPTSDNIIKANRAVFCVDSGFVTENSGTATISSSTYVDVTHGLAGTPTAINVTPATSGTGDWYLSNIGDTTFRINVANSGTYTFHWTAEYNP